MVVRMPAFFMDGLSAEDLELRREPDNEIFDSKGIGPPSTTSSHGSDSLDLILDGVADNSIEQLYYNVCEMQSSDYSPSRFSFLSYGEESRIDSEIRFLARGNYASSKQGGDSIPDKTQGFKIEDFGNAYGNKICPSILPPRSKVSSQPGTSIKTSCRSKILRSRLPNGKLGSKSLTNEKDHPLAGATRKNGTEDHVEADHLLGPYLLKQARDMIASESNTQRALEFSLQAKKSFEMSGGSKPSLNFVLCLHVVAALYCRLGRYSEAIPVLERSIEISVLDQGQNYAIAKFAGCMQLGGTYAMLGQTENSILSYTTGLEIQRQVLGENDHRLAETCRYLAEVHLQTMQFDDAEKLALTALNIHKENGSPACMEEATDRRLLGLICDSKGDYEGALEHYVLAGMTMAAHDQNSDVAAIDCNIGDSYLSLGRYDEAIFSYQKALKTFKSTEGENHSSVASVFVRLADLYNRIGRFGESKSNCKRALKIYAKPRPGSPPVEIASGFVSTSAIYESMNEPNRALQLLQKAIKVYGGEPGMQLTIAGVEAQMGVLYYMLGSFPESYASLKKAISKFRETGAKKSALFGVALNQMGLACVQLLSINEAAGLFEEARSILEVECGPYHADTLGVCSNLAGTYDAMGRVDDAIEILEYVIETREENLGTVNPDMKEEKQRLAELLKEAGMARNRKSRSLETLLVHNSHNITPFEVEV